MPATQLSAIRVHLLTLTYQPQLGAIDCRPLEEFLADKHLIALREHFFLVQGMPHICCVLTYRPHAPISVLAPSLAAPRGPTASPGPDSSKPAAAPCIDLDDGQRSRYAILRRWRAQRARSDGVPAYVIFTNRELAALACTDLRHRDDLLAVSGCGEGKIARYGRDLLDLFAAVTPEAVNTSGAQP